MGKNIIDRTESTLATLKANIIQQVFLVILSFLSRTIFIYFMDANYLGISGLFSNVLGLLSLAELGIGSAITFYLYKPASEMDTERLKTLAHLYKVCYYIIAIAILAFGIALIPFLPKLVNFDVPIKENIYLIYMLTLINTVVSYLIMGYRQSMFTAFQQVYILSNAQTKNSIVTNLISIFILFSTRNYIYYLISLIGANIFNNFVIGIIAGKQYPFLRDKNIEKLSYSEIKGIFKNVYAIFVWNLGNLALVSTDNILISVICGTSIVGYYGNYSLIAGLVEKIYYLIFNAVTPTIGNINAKESKDRQLANFQNLNFVNFWCLCFMTIALIIMLNPVIFFWTSRSGNSGYVLPEITAVIVGLNFFLKWHRNIVGQYKTTKGLFQYGKYMQLILGVTNLFLSVYFGNIWGLNGILAATAISIIIFAWIPQPYYLFKYGFGMSCKPFLLQSIKEFLIFCFCFGVTRWLSGFIIVETFWGFFLRLIIVISVPNLIIGIIYRKTEEMAFVKGIIRIVLRGKKKNE